MNYLNLSIALISLSFSVGAATANVKGRCGDHWFRVDFSANSVSQQGELALSGDSGADEKLAVVYHSNEKGIMTFTSSNPSAYLVLEPNLVHVGSYSGYYNGQAIGSCFVETK